MSCKSKFNSFTISTTFNFFAVSYCLLLFHGKPFYICNWKEINALIHLLSYAYYRYYHTLTSTYKRCKVHTILFLKITGILLSECIRQFFYRSIISTKETIGTVRDRNSEIKLVPDTEIQLYSSFNLR